MNKKLGVAWSMVRNCYVSRNVKSSVDADILLYRKGKYSLAVIIATAILSGGVVMPTNAWAAEYTFGTILDTNTKENNVVVTPSHIDKFGNSNGKWGYALAVYGGGLMYYPKEAISDNQLIVKNTYHDKGLVITTGIYDIKDKTNVKKEIVEENILTIKDSVVNAKGYLELSAGYMGHYASGSLRNNGIIISDSTISADSSIGIYGNLIKMGQASTNGNYVKISNSELKQGTFATIIGGYATKGCSVDSSFVVISGEKTRSIIRNASIYGGLCEYGEIPKGEKVPTDVQMGRVFGNCVDIGVADLSGSNIYGGYSELNGIVEQNVVTIRGNEQEPAILTQALVYGGYSDSGDAIYNTVNINHVNLEGSSLYGGYSAGGGKVVDNSLNVGEHIVGKLNIISGFNAVNFENIKWENGGTVLMTEGLELKDTSVSIKKISGAVKVNDYMNIISSDEEISGKLANAGEYSIEAGVAQIVKVVEGDLSQGKNTIRFTVSGIELNPQVEAIGEAGAVGAAFVANGLGLVEDSINAMICEERIGYKTFAKLHGSDLDFDAANNLNVKGWSSIVGIGETTKDRLTYGVFFETGEGDYRTFAKQREGYICGDGDVEYEGGGLLVRKDYINGIYVEGSLRIGHMNNRVSDAVIDSRNQFRGFDVGSTYYGTHIGIGKMISRGDKERFDFYSKFLYSHNDGDRFVIDGDMFDLDSMNSQRLRLGFRYHKLAGNKLRIYCGGAYEYEFDAKANNRVLHYTFQSPDLGGGTVIGELGYHYNADDKWCFNMNLHGYDGQREGVSGSIQVNYIF